VVPTCSQSPRGFGRGGVERRRVGRRAARAPA
jgi:hypothetical protein